MHVLELGTARKCCIEQPIQHEAACTDQIPIDRPTVTRTLTRMGTRLDASSPAFVVAPNEYGEWGWKLIAGTGHVLAQSGADFESRVDCEDAVELIRRLAPVARFDKPDSSRTAFRGIFDHEGNSRGE
jgi:uncharacterized protein YegP (UPF0339 family)